MGWTIRWRVVVDGRALDRVDPYAIDGEQLEFELYNTRVGIQRRASDPRFWLERFNMRVWGRERLPSRTIVSSPDRPLVITHRVRGAHPTRFYFHGRPMPVSRRGPGMTMTERGLLAPVADPEAEIDLVALEQVFAVYPADSPLGRTVQREHARIPMGQRSATAQGLLARSEVPRQRLEVEAAERQRQRQRELEAEQSLRRSEVRRARAEVLGADAVIPGLLPIRLLSTEEIDALEDIEAAIYMLLLEDLVAVTPAMDLRPVPYTRMINGRLVPGRLRWRVQRTSTHVRFFQQPASDVSWAHYPAVNYHTASGPRYEVPLAAVLKVILPLRSDPIVADGQQFLDEMFTDQMWAAVEFVAIELIGAIIPFEAIVARAFMWIVHRIARPVLRQMLHTGLSSAARAQMRNVIARPGAVRALPRVSGGRTARDAVRAPVRGLDTRAPVSRPTGQRGTRSAHQLGSQRGRGERQIGGRATARQARRRAARQATETRTRSGPWHAQSPEGQRLEQRTLEALRGRARRLIHGYERRGRRSSVGAAAAPGWLEARSQVRHLLSREPYARQTLASLAQRLDRIAQLDHRSNTLAIGRFMRPDGSIVDVFGRSSGGLTTRLRTAISALPRLPGGIDAISATPIRHAHAEWEVLIYGLEREWVPLAIHTNVNICTGLCSPFLREVGFQIHPVGPTARPLTALWRPWLTGQWVDL